MAALLRRSVEEFLARRVSRKVLRSRPYSLTAVRVLASRPHARLHKSALASRIGVETQRWRKAPEPALRVLPYKDRIALTPVQRRLSIVTYGDKGLDVGSHPLFIDVQGLEE